MAILKSSHVATFPDGILCAKHIPDKKEKHNSKIFQLSSPFLKCENAYCQKILIFDQILLKLEYGVDE